jgi:hypothetical protein
MIILILINTGIFFLLALLHMYWAMGGKKYLDDAIPVELTGEVVMSPSRITTFFVALLLLLFAIITIGNIGFLDIEINRKYIHYTTLFVGITFIIRVIGDFKFVGITKRVKGTKFAVKDDQVYIPLCLMLGAFNIIIALYGNTKF